MNITFAVNASKQAKIKLSSNYKVCSILGVFFVSFVSGLLSHKICNDNLEVLDFRKLNLRYTNFTEVIS